MRDEYHMEPECFKFKDAGTTSSYDEVAFLNHLEVFCLSIEKIKNLYIGKLLKFCSVIQIFHAENNMKINILSSW